MLWRSRPVPAGFIGPCLPIKASSPPSGECWLHEIKHDGICVGRWKRIGDSESQSKGTPRMIGRGIVFIVATAALGLGISSANAGPCSGELARFEQRVRQSGKTPTARQTVGAQLHRQPTPASVKQAERRAQSTFKATLARAKRLDAQGNRAGCKRALADAKLMLQ
jgi:hypothetical protein